MVPLSFGCGSAVLAAIATLAPSRAARSAMARPMPRLAPETNSVLPLRDVIGLAPGFNSVLAMIYKAYHRQPSLLHCPTAAAPRVRGSGAPSSPFGATAIELTAVWPSGSVT